MSTDSPGKRANPQPWTFATLLATIIAAPLILLPGLLFYFDVSPKVGVILAGTAVALLLPRNGSPAGNSRASRWLFGLLCAQAVSLTVSAALSSDRAFSFSGSNWRRFGLVTQLALVVFTWLLAGSIAAAPAVRVRWLLRAIAAAGSVAAVYAIFQYFGRDPLLPARAYQTGEGIWAIVRPPGTMGHAAYLATYLLHAVFAGTALVAAEPRGRWKLVGAAACTLGSAAIVLSGTRAAVLGLLAGCVLLFFWSRPRVSQRRAVAAAVAALALVIFYISPAGQKLRSRVHWSAEDRMGGARLLLWRDSLRMATAAPVAGAGLEMFSVRFPRFQSVELSAAYPDFYHESPHNIFLDSLAAQGVPGLIILVLLAGLGFAAAWQARRSESHLSGALAATLAASLASQQFSAFTAATALLFYATVAATVALAPAAGAAAKSRPRAWRTLLLGAGQCGAAGGAAVFTFHLLAADHALEAVRRRLETGDLAGAVEEHARVFRRQPPGISAELWYSRSLMGLAQRSKNPAVRIAAWEQAFEAGKRAVVSPEERQNAFYSLASLYAARNDAAGTERSLRNAIASSPNWYKPHWLLAQVLRLNGRLPEARGEAARAVMLDGGRHADVSRTLADIRAATKYSGFPDPAPLTAGGVPQ